MQVVSSKWSLTLKLLLPAFAGCFLTGITVLLFFISPDSIQEPFTPLSARLTMVSFLLSLVGLYYICFFRIKWVAMDEEYIYVSNFFKSYQYTYDSIARIEESKVLLWKRITIHLHQKGIWGDSFHFLGSYYWYYFLKKHPEVLKKLLPEEIINKYSNS
jgi:hypothetical protein